MKKKYSKRLKSLGIEHLNDKQREMVELLATSLWGVLDSNKLVDCRTGRKGKKSKLI